MPDATDTVDCPVGINEFNRIVGKTVTAWSQLESALCLYFQKLLGIHHVLSRQIFYSARSFQGRSDMIKAVLKVVDVNPPEYTPFLRAALKKAGQLAAIRNMIAHGQAMYVNDPDSPYHEKHIIMQGDEPALVLASDILTQDHLINAADNFLQLSYALLVVYHWDGRTEEKSPAKFLRLIAQIPNEAHSSRLDRSFLEQFEVLDARIEYPR